VAAPLETGRANQKRRTRKALLEAASQLARQGRTPTLEEVAEAALVSRATAYRYFPSIEALMVEAALDVAMPTPEDLFAHGAPADPVARLETVDAAVEEMMAANEAALRLMLANSMERKVRGDADVPARQNRRSALIEAALEPAALPASARRRLARALAVVIGTESMVVLKDVLQLDAKDARELRRWMIRALVAAARSSPAG
jgi:AcrR family transcriptional regulator